MADVDILPSRGITAAALVDGNGVAIGGTQTVAQLAARGMRAICQVDPAGIASSDGVSTVAQLAARGIRAFAAVDELGVSSDDAVTKADTLRMRGIRPLVPVNASGIASPGSASILTLAQRGLGYFCPVDETGTAADLTPVPPNTIRARAGVFVLSGETMTTINEFVMTADNSGVTNKFTLAGQSADLQSPVPTSTTWSPTDKASNITLDTPLIARFTSNGTGLIRTVGSYPRTTGGKHYFELNLNSVEAGGAYYIGICNATTSLTAFPAQDANSVGWNGDEITLSGFRVAGIHTVTIGGGQTACIAIDLNTMRWWHRVGEVGLAWWGSAGITTGDPVTGANPFDISPLGSGPYYVYAFGQANGASATANFGGSAFAFAAPSGYSGW
jgi:hypothetical protein